jgi:hypothetical protein
MNSKDIGRFGLALAAMAENYDKSMSKAGMRLYFQAVSDLTIEQFEQATSIAVRELKWWPKPAEIREIAGKLKPSERDKKEMLAITTANDANEAWAKALKHIMDGKARYGGTGIDEIDHTIRLMGGWPRMSEVKTDEIPFREREFIEKYKTWSQVEQIERIEGEKILDALGYDPKMIN